jgi:hypothetical protein
MREEPRAKLAGFWVDCTADVDNKAKKMSALALLSRYRAELSGLLSPHIELK